MDVLVTVSIPSLFVKVCNDVQGCVKNPKKTLVIIVDLWCISVLSIK